jgi:hypothetical protein
MTRIPNNGAVRSKTTGKLGRTFRPHSGRIPGCIIVQWDGDRDRKSIDIVDVVFVAHDYMTAKVWETEKEAVLVAAVAA